MRKGKMCDEQNLLTTRDPSVKIGRFVWQKPQVEHLIISLDTANSSGALDDGMGQNTLSIPAPP